MRYGGFTWWNGGLLSLQCRGLDCYTQIVTVIEYGVGL